MENNKEIITQMVDAVAGIKKENLSEEQQKKQDEIRKNLAGRAMEYLMFVDN